jgi:hypothetical protein
MKRTPLQFDDHPSASVKREVGVDLINNSHQFEVQFTLDRRLIVIAGSTDAEQVTLPLDAD